MRQTGTTSRPAGRKVQMVHYQVGMKSRAGFPILYDRAYDTSEAARAVITENGWKGHYVFRVTVEEVTS